MNTFEILAAIDLLTTIGFKLYEKAQKLKEDPASITKEEIEALIKVAQPLIDEMADKIEKL